jgi:CRP/FNR family transcriptional regulator
MNKPADVHARIDLRAEILRRSWLFSDLSPDKLPELAAVSVFRRFSKGEIIFRQGDPPDFLYIIGSGRVKQFKTSPSGKAFTTAVNSPGDPLSVAAVFPGKAHFVATQAMSDVSTVYIARKDFIAYVDKYPVIVTRIVHILGLIINSAYERLSDLAGETASQRVLNVLYMLYFKFGSSISFTREQMADLAGTRPETTTRVLAKLKSVGIIRSRRGGVDILDVEKLREVSRGSYLIRLKDIDAWKGLAACQNSNAPDLPSNVI